MVRRALAAVWPPQPGSSQGFTLPPPTPPAPSNVSSTRCAKIPRLRCPQQLWTTLVPLDFQSKTWFVLRPVLLSRLQTGWAGSSESEVGQMEASRGSDGLAGGPPSILLLERHWPRQSGNLLSSQACSFTSDEICYQGRTHVLDGEKSCSDRLPPRHWGEGLGLCCWGEPTMSLASLLTCCVT